MQTAIDYPIFKEFVNWVMIQDIKSSWRVALVDDYCIAFGIDAKEYLNMQLHRIKIQYKLDADDIEAIEEIFCPWDLDKHLHIWDIFLWVCLNTKIFKNYEDVQDTINTPI